MLVGSLLVFVPPRHYRNRSSALFFDKETMHNPQHKVTSAQKQKTMTPQGREGGGGESFPPPPFTQELQGSLHSAHIKHCIMGPLRKNGGK
jgi:hypothetical protein